MKFGHYWPRGEQKIEHLRPWVPRFETHYSSMPVLRFEPFNVGQFSEPTRVERAASVHEALFGTPLS